jgi:gamma-glutamyl:cysteine ligase YbdK (ATP-grasp superfamily)
MPRRLRLFEAFGLELEYMVVRSDTLRVAPVVDRLMIARTGEPASDCRIGRCEASNELAAHVFELKVPRPVTDIERAGDDFADAVRRANKLLAAEGCRLLPGPMHPTMDPTRESHIWRHEGREIYETYDRVFGVRAHGWFNLQSCHINLPFADDTEFALLHAAVILLLPFLPALAAGSPFKEGRVTGWLDTRIDTYRNNQKRFPLVSGRIVPEPVFDEAAYRARILEPMMRQIAPVNDGTFQEGWMNSRGAIARFHRGAIEIRVLDIQECPAADTAIAALVVSALKDLVDTHGHDLVRLARVSSTALRKRQLLACARLGFGVPIVIPEMREALRLPRGIRTAGGLWRTLIERHAASELTARQTAALETILRRGNLAQRLLRHHAKHGRSQSFPGMLGRLADCLASNTQFAA